MSRVMCHVSKVFALLDVCFVVKGLFNLDDRHLHLHCQSSILEVVLKTYYPGLCLYNMCYIEWIFLYNFFMQSLY